MKKIRTGIAGFDKLLYGGLQIGCNTDVTQCHDDESLVIVIKGMKGTNKPLLAMQLMYGIARSLHEGQHLIKSARSQFYSINKTSDKLNDMYIDFFIKSQLHKMIRHYKKDVFNETDEDTVARHRKSRYSILHFLFDMEKSLSDQSLMSRNGFSVGWLSEKLVDYVCQSLAHYNVRTNSLHVKRRNDGDDKDNYIATRRFNSIKRYALFYRWLAIHRPEIVREVNDGGIEDNFIRNIIPVEFNRMVKPQKENGLRYYRKSPMSIFRDIQNAIQEQMDRAGGLSRQNACNHTSGSVHSGDNRLDVIVVDGFSQMTSDELQSLPYTNMLQSLRKASKVSILVFDDRTEAKCDGDIVIEMRKNYSEPEEYMFHELQISKSTFQEAAIGWHQYKRRDDGIEVFPSLHRLLSKRYYMPNQSLQIGQSVFEEDFEHYISSCDFLDVLKKMKQEHLSNGTKSDDKAYNHEKEAGLAWKEIQDFLDYKDAHEENLQKYLFDTYVSEINKDIQNHVTQSDTSEDPDNRHPASSGTDVENADVNNSQNPFITYFCRIFTDVPDLDKLPFGWKNHFDATALIGNPNCYKRYLAMLSAYSYAKRGVHTLFILFDKNEMDMRRQMVCPACVNYAGYGQKGKKCAACSKRLHMIDLRMGCISSEEFFSTLIDQISLYCDYDKHLGIERKWMHIVIDDLQKIDFSFPFLSSHPLFLSTLISICRDHNVRLTILCDKNAKLVKELCSLADNVVTIHRVENQLQKVTINIGRGSANGKPSRIVRYKTDNILKLFKCDHEITIDNSLVTFEEIGSLKGYWRKTINNIPYMDSLE